MWGEVLRTFAFPKVSSAAHRARNDARVPGAGIKPPALSSYQLFDVTGEISSYSCDLYCVAIHATPHFMPDQLPGLLTIGTHIRERVIPPGVSVKDAAQKLGVGRPALSNLLNGNATLSPEMALRLEKAFGADQQELLDLQARFNRERNRDREKGIGVRTDVPTFLAIKARQIEQWADSQIDARHQLSVLLRRLIHSTGNQLHRVDFPGYDNAERRGWDGCVEAGAATAWIPEGESGWEFGVDEDSRRKAEKDYAARLASVPPEERADCTFVFVTPRNWKGKSDWIAEKSARGEWKAVRAYDASDLEQWLEESVATQIWLAEKLGRPITGFETLGHCLDRWTSGSEPPMAREIFEPSIAAHRSAFVSWLKKTPEKPFTVAADSRDEALAFLAYLFDDPDISEFSDRVAVFESAETLRTLAPSTSPFIPIATTVDAERELGGIYRRYHSIIVRPRNAVDSKARHRARPSQARSVREGAGRDGHHR